MSRPAFHIRAAKPADIGAITRIYGDEVAHGIASLEETPPPESEMAARMAKITGLGLPYLVAEKAGRVLGYSYASPFHTRSAYRFTLEDTIYIDRDARGQGVGRALVEALLIAAEQIGCRQMMALISYVDDSVSVRLHEKLGFRPLGVATAVGYKFGRWIDVMYMQRRIGDGDATPPDRAAPGR